MGKSWIQANTRVIRRKSNSDIFYSGLPAAFLNVNGVVFQDQGETRTYNMSINTDQVTLKKWTVCCSYPVSDFANGDYLKSVTPKGHRPCNRFQCE